MKKFLILGILPALLAACADSNTGSNGYGNADGFGEESLSGSYSAPITDDSYLLAAAPKYYIGNAYKLENTQYVPSENYAYNETGIAGIIPTELNGTQTSDGEVFNADQLIATSKVLPLPSIVNVTNLDTGASAILRVNNRGPFVNNRIMDVSPAAAKRLGMTGQTNVRVQILAEQSKAVKAATLGNAVSTPVVDGGAAAATTAAASGNYDVQVAAFYSEDNASALANRLGTYGNVKVVQESGMYKVRIVGLDANGARNAIEGLRANEGMAPGLLQNGRWVNANSI
jgi:rare lipoprotein A